MKEIKLGTEESGELVDKVLSGDALSPDEAGQFRDLFAEFMRWYCSAEGETHTFEIK